MIWLFYALFSRLLWSACNAAEQVMNRSHKQSPVSSSFVLFLSLQFPLGILILFLNGFELQPNIHLLYWLIPGAALNMLAYIPFYKCLQTDDAHSVVPFFEFTPVFLIVLSCLFLQEVLTPLQIVGGLLVILCGFLFSWDFKKGHIRARTLFLMALSSFLFSVFQFCLRKVSDHADVWTVSGLCLTVIGFFGCMFFITNGKARRSIISTALATGGHNIKLASIANFFAFAGTSCLISAFQTAPSTGHVAALSGSQPFFSFFLAVVLGKIWANHYSAIVFDRETNIKLSLIVGIFGGIYMLVHG